MSEECGYERHGAHRLKVAANAIDAELAADARITRAEVAQLASPHVRDAIDAIAALMKDAGRESVRLGAAVKLIELATEDLGGEGDGGTKVYVLQTGAAATPDAPQLSTGDMARKLRERLRGGAG